MAQPNAQWYDLATLNEMHDDLRTEYAKTLAVINDRPQLLKHFRDCAECQTIKSAQEVDQSLRTVQLDAHRRRKLFLRYSELHAIMGLKPEQSIVALEITQDPMSLTVIITGPDEPVIPVNVHSPVTALTVEVAR